MFIHTGPHYFCPISMNTNINSLYFAYESGDWRKHVNLDNIKNYQQITFPLFSTNQSGWSYLVGGPTPATSNINYGWSFLVGNSFPSTNSNSFGWTNIIGNLTPTNTSYGWITPYAQPLIENNTVSSLSTSITSQDNKKIQTSTTAAQTTSPNSSTQALTQGTVSNADAKKFAKSIAQNAENYIGYNENDGSYRKFSNSKEWCADFVTYVVKESYAKQGKVPPAGFGSWRCENLKQWAINNNKFLQTAGKLNKAQLISQYVKPGDILILRENGASHTGIVKAINTKTGAFTTVEGNVKVKNGSDCVTTNSYSPYDAEISGFIQLV